MAKVVAVTGDAAVAEAMRQIEPDVVGVYPITPQTIIVEKYAEYVARGEVDTEYVGAESEHSAMSICIGAAAAGARTMTATSSQGLALMWEMLYIAAGLRLPIVMFNVNRALSAPINIHCDHSDSMGARDSGWVQIYSENAQEAYDNMIQAVKIAEHEEVFLPVMVLMDGFTISHSLQRAEILDDPAVKKFVGKFEPVYPLLDTKHPVTWGAFDSLYGYYFEFKRAQAEAMEKTKEVALKVGEDYAKLSGRKYGLFETYRMDDAEVGLVAIGSVAGTARVAVDDLRRRGVKVGLLKVRLFRPWPAEELASALSHLKVCAVVDRAHGLAGQGGPLFEEVKATLYTSCPSVIMTNYVAGLGGREITLDDITQVYTESVKVAQAGKAAKEINYLGLRE